jgi:hypothetical protein
LLFFSGFTRSLRGKNKFYAENVSVRLRLSVCLSRRLISATETLSDFHYFLYRISLKRCQASVSFMKNDSVTKVTSCKGVNAFLPVLFILVDRKLATRYGLEGPGIESMPISVAERLLRLRVRILSETWIFVLCVVSEGKRQDVQDKETSTDKAQSTREHKKKSRWELRFVHTMGTGSFQAKRPGLGVLTHPPFLGWILLCSSQWLEWFLVKFDVEYFHIIPVSRCKFREKSVHSKPYITLER